MTQPKVHGGFTQAELEAAFSLVQNEENWKYPIDAVVTDVRALDAIRAAVPFFTGSVAEVTPYKFTKKHGKHSEGSWRVKAAGYYLTIGS